MFDTFEQVKDGGLVLFTYNCSVFNTQYDPFREFLKLFIDTMGQEPIEQTKSAMHLMEELVGEQAGYFSQNLIADRFRRSARAGARKVYQEFMNIDWEHYFAHEIMPMFLRRGFKLCGDAAHLNNAKAQALPVSMVERLNRYPNRIISETLYDFSVNRSHRSDLYIKNAEKVPHSEIIDFWADARLVLRVKHDQLEMNRTFRLNEDLRLNPAKFGPVFSALASGPEKFGQLRRFFPDGPEGDTEMMDIIRIGHALGYLNLYYGEDLFEDHDQSVLDFDAGLTAWIRETKAPAYHLFLPNGVNSAPFHPGSTPSRSVPAPVATTIWSTERPRCSATSCGCRRRPVSSVRITPSKTPKRSSKASSSASIVGCARSSTGVVISGPGERRRPLIRWRLQGHTNRASPGDQKLAACATAKVSSLWRSRLHSSATRESSWR